MTARIGAHGLDLFHAARPELLASVVRGQQEDGGKWVNIEHRKNPRGFHSTQRIYISDVDEGVAVATWPAETAEQARYLYGGGLGAALVTAATSRNWKVEPSPHIAYINSPPSRRLYMTCPTIDALAYVSFWEAEGALRRMRYPRERVEAYLWRWLKQRGLANDEDNNELHRFLNECLSGRDADMRPGLRFRRVWTSARVDELGSNFAFAAAIRSEFNAVFAAAHEPTLETL
jgi:hypothetical protein